MYHGLSSAAMKLVQFSTISTITVAMSMVMMMLMILMMMMMMMMMTTRIIVSLITIGIITYYNYYSHLFCD